MTITAVVDLTRAKLCNTPAITRFESATSSLASLKRGGLFITSCKDQIPLALEKGAYGILCDDECEILDDECAWMVVDDLSKAVLNLIKYLILHHHITTISCDEATFELSSQLITTPAVGFYSTPIEMLQALIETTSLTHLFIPISFAGLLTPTASLCVETGEKIDPMFSPISLGATLFRKKDQAVTTKLSPPYGATVEKIISYSNQEGLPYTIPPSLHTTHFIPMFVTSSLTLAESGQTHMITIFSKATQEEMILHEISTVTHLLPWGRTIVFLPKTQYSGKLSYNKIVQWETSQDIKHWLTTHHWEVALIYGAQQEEVLVQTPLQPTLF